jgi:predicted enzyme related to lactoylglutathione lyase
MSKRNVVHIEIPAADVPAASKFYQDLFGWKMQHDAQFDYTMWQDGSGNGGGFNRASDENPVGQVMVYIHSDDIDADLKKVEQLGGTVVTPKTEIPGTGWFAAFKDPTGNTLALYTSMNPESNQ